MRSARILLSIIWIGILVFAMALAIYVKFSTDPEQFKQLAGQTGPEGNRDYGRPFQERRIKLWVPEWYAGKMEFRVLDSPPLRDEEPVQAAMRLLMLRVPQFPRGIKDVRTDVQDGVAVVDFVGMPQPAELGADERQGLLESIQRTLGQFGPIERVRLLADGKPLAQHPAFIAAPEALPVIR